MTCKGKIAREYLGRMKKNDTKAIFARKNKIKKFIKNDFLLDKIIPITDVTPISKIGK